MLDTATPAENVPLDPPIALVAMNDLAVAALDAANAVKFALDALTAPIGTPLIVPPVIATALEFWVAIDPRPVSDLTIT